MAGCRVLVVDDEVDARLLTSQMLTARGAEVSVVGSAGDALHAIQVQRFDAMVSDIGMPGEDGYALIRAVRDLTVEDGSRVPAVALTAYASLHDRKLVLAAGFDAHVPKPVEPQELVTAVVNVISARSTMPPAATAGKL